MTDVVAARGETGTGPAPAVVTWTDAPRWDAFAVAASDGTLAHRWGWGEVISATYGHRTFRLAAVRGETLVGLLPLVLVRSRLFGRELVSMPYLDYGGLCTDGDAAAEAALLGAATQLAQRHRCRLVLRHLHEKQLDLRASLEKVTLTLEIGGGEDAAWAGIRPNRRSQVRKAGRLGLTAHVGGVEAVGDFYRVWSANMRDLGSPVHPRSFFERILRSFEADARVLLVRDGPRAVGGGIVLRHGNRVVLPWSSSLRESLPKGPNQLLYWEAIRHGINTGAATFDFGRSSRSSGTFDAKREWGAQPVQLFWHGAGEDGGDDRLRQLDWATAVWRRLPLPVTVAVGARVRGGITR
jgi:FemAB-related protein (PEP-CTERM system-associated)